MRDSDIIILTENLGKKYTLQHNQPERYRVLRDSIGHKLKAAGQWLNPFTLRGQLRRSEHHAAHEQKGSAEDFWALKDINFEIRRGERVGIIGCNGAGKSTLLKILSRITEPTTGRVEIRGRVASLLEVGTGFHPELTGRENIYLNGAVLGMSKKEIRSKFDEIVDFADVERFLDTPVKRYSSGMYVRLAFAVAAHLEPEILVVDEVLAVGDASFQKKCLGKMEDVAEREGRTILFVSHNMTAVKSICRAGILLRSGTGEMHSEIDEAINKYNSESIFFPTLLERSWQPNSSAPGDNQMRLTSVNIEQESNSDPFYDNNPITIHVHVICGARAHSQSVGLIVTDASGSVAIHTLSSASHETPKKLQEGTNHITFTLPKGILKAGKYQAEICGVESMASVHFRVEAALCFTVISTNYEFNRHGEKAWLATSSPSVCKIDIIPMQQ